MDLFDYASELLKQHGELKVPGLGYFVHLRKPSYYEQETGSIYPPYYETTFDPHGAEDDDTTLISYFSEQKHISLASSKYFLDKFVEKLKLQAETDEVNFSDLGLFYIDDQAQLAFRPNPLEMSYYSSLYGYAPVSIQKLADYGQPVKPRKIVAPAPVYVPKTMKEQMSTEGRVLITSARQGQEAAPMPVTDGAINNDEEDDYTLPDLEDDEEEGLGLKNNLIYWISITAFVVACVAGSIYYYKNYIQKAERVVIAKKPAPPPEVATPPPAAKSDTSKKIDTVVTGGSLSAAPVNVTDSLGKANQQANQAATNADSKTVTTTPSTATPGATQPAATKPGALKPTAQAALKPDAGTIPKDSWMVIGGTYNNINSANRTLGKYRKLGYSQARLLDSIPKKVFTFYKIIFSYHPTKEEAVAARRELLKPRILNSKYITVQQNKP